MSEPLSPDRLALLLGLSFFFGLTYEEFYGRNAAPSRPGGIRTFPLLALAGAGCYLIEPAHGAVFGPHTASADLAALAPRNPLELTAAVIFAVAFMLVSLATSWATLEFGQNGVLWLAAIVGVADIDPFALSLAQGGGSGLAASGLVAAILIAASSNNMLKAAYCLGFAGWRVAYAPALALVVLALAGGLAATLLR